MSLQIHLYHQRDGGGSSIHSPHRAPSSTTISTDIKPEPTADTEPELAAMPESELKPEPYIALEPEPNKSDQVRELATMSMPVDILVEYEGIEWSPVPLTMADVDVLNSEDLIYLEESKNVSTKPVSLPSTELLLSLMFLACLPPPLPVPSQPRELFLRILSVLCRLRRLFLRCLSVLCWPREIFLRSLPVLFRPRSLLLDCVCPV